ncbi:MAG: glycosyltransferase family 39 protein [Gammaproteobacteria bacterium]|nr:glycosyltransferase family 39 protein [Gammaproteobacteria bacterium]
MFKDINRTIFILVAVILASRFISMILIPYGDTTEARYGEMARIMAETGDWITPFFDYGIPFWGKPPLSFWSQAAFFNLFGIHELSGRFPSWLATLGIIILIYKLVRIAYPTNTSLITVLIFSSTFIAYLMSGAVLTDPYLTLATTMSLSAFAAILYGQTAYWRYLFFVGIAIGLLAKGPIAIILIGGPIGLWLLISSKRWSRLGELPWFSGIFLIILLVAPWYIAAEMKTPGFIEYFILGEHYYRFVDPGWAGDLYGTAHKQPRGTIWLLWMLAAFPWSLYAIYLLIKNITNSNRVQNTLTFIQNESLSFFFIWALFPMLFFTMAGNILITYTLPAIPALAIILATKLSNTTKFTVKLTSMISLAVPIFILAITSYLVKNPDSYPSEKELINAYYAAANQNSKLVFLDDVSFSAKFYSQRKVDIRDSKHIIDLTTEPNLYFVSTKKRYEELSVQFKTKVIDTSYDYVLFLFL